MKLNLASEIRSWILTLSLIAISGSGVVLSLICIYALPDHSVKPLEGGLYFLCTTIITIGLLLYIFNKEKSFSVVENKQLELNNIIIVESISDKIIKWLTIVLSLFFVFWSYATALICIYALPDKSVQPVIGVLFFLCGTVVLISLIMRIKPSLKNTL